jgi:hypothetical protein
LNRKVRHCRGRRSPVPMLQAGRETKDKGREPSNTNGTR